MQTFKKIIAFVLANVIVVASLSFILSSPSIYKMKFDEFKKGDYNTIIVGHSFGSNGIDPHLLNNSDDEKAFNLCQPSLDFSDLHYIIEQANEDGKIKKVYLDICQYYWFDGRYDRNRSLRCYDVYDNLSLKNKISYIMNVFAKEKYNDFFFRYKGDSGDISKIPKNIKIKCDPRYRNGDTSIIDSMYSEPGVYKYMGQGYTCGVNKKDDIYIEDQFDSSRIKSGAIKDFDEIISYCKDNDIELICFISALPIERLQNENRGEAHDYFMQLCESRGIELYDMNYVKFKYIPRTSDDYIDRDGHMKHSIAVMQTTILNEILNSNNKEQYFESNYEEVLSGIDEYKG